MSSLFNKKDQTAQGNPLPNWLPLLDETKERLFIFLAKLEERMQKLVDEAVPELQSLKIEDEREYGTMYNGVQGQLNSIRSKAQKTYEEKIEDLYQQLRFGTDVLSPYYPHLSDFRTVCSHRFHQEFEDKYHQCREQLAQTEFTDYEVLYQQILEEHDQIKNRFKCHQCGDTIPLSKIYFITTHLTCPSCQTKNTFHPSTLARGLEHIGRGLAEQRTQHLLKKYHQAQQAERALYHQAHELTLKSYNVKDTQQKKQILQEIERLHKLRQETEKNIPVYYQQYQRAMFDEWKGLVPDLAEQTENFYQGLQRRN